MTQKNMIINLVTVSGEQRRTNEKIKMNKTEYNITQHTDDEQCATEHNRRGTDRTENWASEHSTAVSLSNYTRQNK